MIEADESESLELLGILLADLPWHKHDGDAHLGALVRIPYGVAVDPNQVVEVWSH